MRFEEILTIAVVVDATAIVSVTDTLGRGATMLPFGGSVSGKYFNGKILPGGIDTQISASGETLLSARYMLEGTDIDGRRCKMYIENNGLINPTEGGPLFRTNPKIMTDSPALSFLHGDFLVSEGFASEGGVTITVFRAVDAVECAD